MDKRSLKTLEFDKIIQKLANKAISQGGKAMCENLSPMDRLGDIEKALAQTAEALEFSTKAGHLPLGGIKDITASLKRATIGGVLSIEELFHVGEFIYVCKKIERYASSVERRERLEHLDPLFEEIVTAAQLEKDITRCIVNDKEIADDASAALSAIRRSIKTSSSRINDALNSVIQSQNYKNMLQDAVITMRSGRYCVPIKQEYKSSFPGVVHDSSGSGATVFMEPLSVVALNNKIKELQAEEKEEILRILTKLSADVSANEAELRANIDVLTYLDFIFAKSSLAFEMEATAPEFNDNGIIDIKKGRHPLLNVPKIVPMDIHLGRDFSSLLITGPNTGGKTVALKITGLFTLMGMAGLFIPAKSGSALSIFDSVYADIGDEQSIEQSLSTFSAHMTNIVRILGLCNHESLVLFDELGAGTDPTEGAALAISVIRNLMARGVKCAITTHYAELKLFALTTEGVENGAVEFDLQTLAPTYRLLIGVPGKSNAFAIAARLGLSPEIISEAKELLSADDIRFEDVITDLEISKKAAEIEEERTQALRRETQKLAHDLENQKKRLELNRERVMNEAKSEARKLVAQAKEEADAIIKEMRKMQINPDFKSAEESRKKLREKMDTLEVSDIKKETAQKPAIRPIDRPLVAGDTIFVNHLGQSGTVVSVSKNHAQVAIGAMEMKVKISELSLEERKQERQVASVASGVRASKSLHINREIDLRGMLAQEALEELSKYLDDAYLSNLGRVEIIHGKGTGALRTAVQQYLKRHPHVKTYRLGEHGEGDSGVTIAELK